ncbi:MAG TPA: 16S rRNA processing protein RimM [Anaerolineaceae bacterium]|uniref:Ribosome maturation factor RimM n=1 Tax=Anaerolinea thermophila TaxID=167964 RepID=A0A101FWS1_9CHLR|nr:MAG: Ribosome maturation factor RimM [Anaerolinea thermophila]HAF62060.1 16S rRNA processing protein RimM [Anaerolineaceae bacterium]
MVEDPFQKKNPKAGSPDQGEPIFLIIGKIRKPHGVGGEVLFEVITEFPERIRRGKKVFIGQGKTEYVVEGIRTHQSNLLIKLIGLEDCESVEQFRNQMVYIKTDNLPRLPEDEYYHHELVGMFVHDEDGILLGQVSEILETGANDVLIVTHEGEEILIPFIKQVILGVNKKEKIISAKLQEWK